MTRDQLTSMRDAITRSWSHTLPEDVARERASNLMTALMDGLPRDRMLKGLVTECLDVVRLAHGGGIDLGYAVVDRLALDACAVIADALLRQQATRPSTLPQDSDECIELKAWLVHKLAMPLNVAGTYAVVEVAVNDAWRAGVEAGRSEALRELPEAIERGFAWGEMTGLTCVAGR